MELNKDSIPALAIAALLGTSGGGGVSTYLSNQHVHPNIIKEIRFTQYESEVFKLTVQIAGMETAGEEASAAYTVAVAQLVKFNAMLADLK